MTDFLLELRSEEIPARMQDKAREDLATRLRDRLGDVGIHGLHIRTYSTPRRLAVIVHDLALMTPAGVTETKGPRTSAPQQALDGFLRSTGLSMDQLEDRNGIWFATVEKPGRATADVLAEAIPAIVRAFPWPKSMRWGEASLSTESLRWVRPLQGIVALLGETVVPCEVAGVAAGNTTVGHRFHHPDTIAITSAATYVDQLRDAYVVVDQNERRATIAVGAKMAANKAGLTLVEDEALVGENAGLTEWPVPLLGRFDDAFLDVPPEVIQLTARVNQKYFVCNDASGKLANAFICTANIDAADGGEKIVEGNRKVLAARLSDARFFYETDLKTKLDDLHPKLEKIVFHEKLGTVADKVDRVAKLARWLVEEGIVTSSPSLRSWGEGRGEGPDSQAPADPTAPSPDLAPLGHPLPASGEREHLADLAERAARLAKADLVTGMVGEFPELQGLMGGYYAAAQGEDPAVAAAIRDHYKPVGQGDEVPTAPITVAVSLADKLDTLTGFFLIDQQPSGSRDPYALRRAALAIATLQTVTQLRAPLLVVFANAIIGYAETAINWSQRALPEVQRQAANLNRWTAVREFATQAGYFEHIPQPETSDKELKAAHALTLAVRFSTPEAMWAKVQSLIEFMTDRLKVQQREAGVRHDLIDAVFALGGEDDLVRLLARVHALQAFMATEDGASLLAGYKRAANILKKEGGVPEGAGTNASPEPAEAALIAALDAAEPKAAAAVEAEDFEGAMAALATLRAPIDAFFTDVTVNDADPAKRASRLALLARMRDAVHRVADFAKIEG